MAKFSSTISTPLDESLESKTGNSCMAKFSYEVPESLPIIRPLPVNGEVVVGAAGSIVGGDDEDDDGA